MTRIKLSSSEIILAGLVGIFRQVQNMANGATDRHGAEKQDRILHFAQNISGCLGEMAVAKHLDLFWSGSLGRYDVADVGLLQVRTTTHKNGRLRINESDRDSDLFIHVINEVPFFNLMGWLPAYSCKQEKYWQDPTGKGRPAYFVSNDDLRPMNTITDPFEKERYT